MEQVKEQVEEKVDQVKEKVEDAKEKWEATKDDPAARREAVKGLFQTLRKNSDND